MEKGETMAQTAVRELKEETNLDVTLGPIVCELADPDGRKSFFFIATSHSGELAFTGPELEEARAKAGGQQYIPEWVSIQSLHSLTVYPSGMTTGILSAFQQLQTDLR